MPKALLPIAVVLLSVLFSTDRAQAQQCNRYDSLCVYNSCGGLFWPIGHNNDGVRRRLIELSQFIRQSRQDHPDLTSSQAIALHIDDYENIYEEIYECDFDSLLRDCVMLISLDYETGRRAVEELVRSRHMAVRLYAMRNVTRQVDIGRRPATHTTCWF